MSDHSKLTRRERQIMDVLFTRGEATVNQIAEALPDPPTPMAVRRMMHILEEKGHLRRREQGREVVYAPKQSKDKAGRSAFEKVLETFFGGSLPGPYHRNGLRVSSTSSSSCFSLSS